MDLGTPKGKFRLSSSMLAFLALCRDAGQTVIPQTAFIYLSAVRKFLEEDIGIDVKFFKRSQIPVHPKHKVWDGERISCRNEQG